MRAQLLSALVPFFARSEVDHILHFRGRITAGSQESPDGTTDSEEKRTIRALSAMEDTLLHRVCEAAVFTTVRAWEAFTVQALQILLDLPADQASSRSRTSARLQNLTYC